MSAPFDWHPAAEALGWRYVPALGEYVCDETGDTAPDAEEACFLSGFETEADALEIIHINGGAAA